MLATSPYFSDTFDFRIADPIFEDLTYKYAWALRAQTPYEDGPNIDPSLTLYNPSLNMTGTIGHHYEGDGSLHDDHEDDNGENDDVPNERNDLCEKDDASSYEEEDVSSDERQCIGHADDKVAPFSTVASPAVRPSILSVRSPSTPRVGREVSSSPLSSLEDLPALSSPPERRSKRLKSMPAVQYTIEDGDDSDEDMPAKRRKPLSAVQDDEETRGRRSSSPQVEAPEKSARKGKGPAKSKGAKRMTARRAATAAKKVKENKKPGKNGLPAKTVSLSPLSYLVRGLNLSASGTATFAISLCATTTRRASVISTRTRTQNRLMHMVWNSLQRSH